MLVVNRREQLGPDGLSSRSWTVNSLHPRSPNIRVKFKLLVLSYHRKKPTLWLIKEIPHQKLEEPRKAATSSAFVSKNSTGLSKTTLLPSRNA